MTLLADAFYALKQVLLGLVPLSADAMHMHVGLLLFLVIAALVRSERRFTIAFLAVLATCLAGEALDLVYDLHAGNAPRWRNGIKDIIGTMLWPGVWAILWSRRRRHAFGASLGYVTGREVAHGGEPTSDVGCPIDATPRSYGRIR